MEITAAELWGHEPTLPGNVVFIVVFVLLTAVHLYMRWDTGKSAKFMNPLIAGGIFEVVGYGARAAGTANPTAIMPYALQSLFLLLAPVLFAATCYMTLGRIIAAADAERYSRIPARWLTKTFTISDVICFLIQAVGGGLQSITGNPSLPTIGVWVVVAGLILQLICFSGYVLLTIDLHMKLSRNSTEVIRHTSLPWKRLLQTIYVVSFLITLRNIVRVVEYAQGRDGWIITHEVMLYTLDGVPMAMVMLMLAAFHPAKVLQRYSNTPRGKMESEMEMSS